MGGPAFFLRRTAGQNFGLEVFACFGKNLFWCGGVAVLQGFLRILWCSVVVNRGEVVVNCVAHVVEKQSFFWGLKNRTGS
jgi:hypothetical protein